MKSKASTKTDSSEKKRTGIYLPDDLLRRLGQYLLDKHGTTHGRNEIVVRAIEEFLKKAGY